MPEPTLQSHYTFADAHLYVWNTLFNDKPLLNLAYVSHDTLRLCLELKSMEVFNKLVADLEAGTPPDTAFPKGTQSHPLNTITELRYCEPQTILEIQQEGRLPIVICDRQQLSYRELYQHLHHQLAPSVKPVEAPLSWRTNLYGPCLGLVGTLAIGVLLICWAGMANPNPGVQNGVFEMLMDFILSTLGVWGTAALVLVIASLFVVVIVRRIRDPIKAEVVTIPGATRR